MKTIFRFVATTILLAVSYLSFGQSLSQRHKIQDPIKLYADLNFTITTGAMTFAYSAVGGDDSFATLLTKSDFEATLNYVRRWEAQLINQGFYYYRQYVEEIYAAFNSSDYSWFKTLFLHVYTEYTIRASVDPRIPYERRIEYRGLDKEQKRSIENQNWETIADLCVAKYLTPLLK